MRGFRVKWLRHVSKGDAWSSEKGECWYWDEQGKPHERDCQSLGIYVISQVSQCGRRARQVYSGAQFRRTIEAFQCADSSASYGLTSEFLSC